MPVDKDDELRSGTYFQRLSNRQIKHIYSRLPPCINRNTIGCDLKHICLLCDKSIASFTQLIHAREEAAKLDEAVNVQEWYGGQYEAMTSVTGHLMPLSRRIEQLQSQLKENKEE